MRTAGGGPRDPVTNGVSRRIERLARYVMEDFQDDITVLCVLKGGYTFCVDLVESIKVLGRNSNKYLETRVEFIRLKSYLVGGAGGGEHAAVPSSPNQSLAEEQLVHIDPSAHVSSPAVLWELLD